MTDFQDSFEIEPGSPQWVALWYDRFGGSYLAHSAGRDEAVLAWLDVFAEGLPEGARVLDLGCGAGIPATGRLAERYAVTGVDVSAGQIARASLAVPEARFVQGDMLALDFEAGAFEGVVSLYALPHLGRAAQLPMLRRIAHWLRPGGLVLANWLLEDRGESSGDGIDEPLRDADEAKGLCRDAGLAVRDMGVTAAEEVWCWILAERRGL